MEVVQMVGKLRDLAQFLNLIQNEMGYQWVVSSNIYAQIVQKTAKNIFSTVGLGVSTVEFTIRKRDISLANALMFNGQHCFITNIAEHADSRNFYKVTTAAITPKICSVQRRTAELDPIYNRPILSENTKITFPACVTEKYIKTAVEIPQTNTEQCLVLVTPKAITLKVGEQIMLEGKVWRVVVPHELDNWKNEYEIIRNDDA